MKPPRIPGTRAGRTLLLLPAIDDDLDEQTKNALAIGNQASVSGTCPDCDATPELYRDLDHEGIYRGVFQHEPDCHALTDGAAA